jgi:hypothetical protein
MKCPGWLWAAFPVFVLRVSRGHRREDGTEERFTADSQGCPSVPGINHNSVNKNITYTSSTLSSPSSKENTVQDVVSRDQENHPVKYVVIS